MTIETFNKSVIESIRDMMRRNEQTPQGNDDWSDLASATSFPEWLERNNDAIDDPGGNIIPSRVQANHDIYKNGNPFE